MHRRTAAGVAIGAGLVLMAAAPRPGTAPMTLTSAASHHRSNGMITGTARGPFQVKLTPQPVHSAPGGATLARLTIDKEFHGDLEATSTGEMLSAAGSVKGSAGYVAMELVQGTLAGRRGSFALQHSATMDQGTATLSVTVVPGSGMDGLADISGRMNIIIAGKGEHSYEFEYSIPGPS